jgi:hypothetical protein
VDVKSNCQYDRVDVDMDLMGSRICWTARHAMQCLDEYRIDIEHFRLKIISLTWLDFLTTFVYFLTTFLLLHVVLYR